jgi:hypothetical protein
MNPFAELHVNISIVDLGEFNIFLIRSISLISLGRDRGDGDADLDADLARCRRIQKNKK